MCFEQKEGELKFVVVEIWALELLKKDVDRVSHQWPFLTFTVTIMSDLYGKSNLSDHAGTEQHDVMTNICSDF